MAPLSKISGCRGLSVSALRQYSSTRTVRVLVLGGTVQSLFGHDTIRIRWTGCEAFNLAERGQGRLWGSLTGSSVIQVVHSGAGAFKPKQGIVEYKYSSKRIGK